ncbi:hypothetical protein J8M20_16470 [Pseudoalteromonas luteoviolacea]|uniref:hypothetical protein n=1 Tax=Pseudoalteromonas luteoviolacea TaxID=43657 RepID=UPI001B399568|nr:hypothetical protein [Pseudoalteromonas luteoviolacea]MBQ4812957.1 hypothetical protein [Pseudoalteromonas luteoviolacea]
MKKSLLSLTLSILPLAAQAGQDVLSTELTFVSQLDNSATQFEFSVPRLNTCGTNLYLVKSPTTTVANRKQQVALLAFRSEATFDFHDSEVCENGYAVVKWVRARK